MLGIMLYKEVDENNKIAKNFALSMSSLDDSSMRDTILGQQQLETISNTLFSGLVLLIFLII